MGVGIQHTSNTPLIGQTDWEGPAAHAFLGNAPPLMLCNGSLFSISPLVIAEQEALINNTSGGVSSAGQFYLSTGSALTLDPTLATQISAVFTGAYSRRGSVAGTAVLVMFASSDVYFANPLAAWQVTIEDLGSLINGVYFFNPAACIFSAGLIESGATYSFRLYTSVSGLTANTTCGLGGLLVSGPEFGYRLAAKSIVGINGIDVSNVTGGYDITLSLTAETTNVINGNAANITLLQSNESVSSGLIASSASNITDLQNAVLALQNVLASRATQTINEAAITGGSNFNFGANGTLDSVT